MWYRIAFGLAGAYNLSFGLWAALWPAAFFEWFRLKPPVYPSIWACLGMVVGLYGLLYGYAAWRLESARPIIAVGLAGKVLGPLGLLVNAAAGELPMRMLTLLVFNDLLWWLPFGLFLLEGSRFREQLARLAPCLCGIVHLVAVAALTGLAGGSEIEPTLADRIAFIHENTRLWQLSWAIWMTAAASLLGMYAWWGAFLPRPWALVGVSLAALGLACDWCGESLYIGWLPDIAEAQHAAVEPVASFEAVQQTGTTLTAVFGNGLYTLGGIVLTLRTRAIRGWLAVLTWLIWIAGISMSICSAVGFVLGVIWSTTTLFPLFIVWCFWMQRAVPCDE